MAADVRHARSPTILKLARGTLYPRWQTAVYRSFYLLVLTTALFGLILARYRPIPGQEDGVRFSLLLLASISVTQALLDVIASASSRS